MTIDAHLHLWDRSRSRYGWLGPEHGVLNEDHLPPDIADTLSQEGIQQVVLVQADDTIADTESMIDIAESWPTVGGVVGWVQLDSPTLAVRHLDRWATQPVVKGIRHLVHDDPRTDFLELPEVQESLQLVTGHGLTLDLPDAWPGGFTAQVPALADRHPELTIVLDHLGKPPHGGAEFPAWAAMLAEIAQRPNTFAKLSGLADDHDHRIAREHGLDAVPAIAERWRPAFETALAAFGPERMLYGSDWPITRLGLDYHGTHAALRTLVDALSTDEQSAVLGGTAARVYRLT